MAFRRDIVAAGIVTMLKNGEQTRRVQVSSVIGGQMVIWTHPGEEVSSKIYHLPKKVRTKEEAVKMMLDMDEFNRNDKAWLKQVDAGVIPLQPRRTNKAAEAKAAKIRAKVASTLATPPVSTTSTVDELKKQAAELKRQAAEAAKRVQKAQTAHKKAVRQSKKSRATSGRRGQTSTEVVATPTTVAA